MEHLEKFDSLNNIKKKLQQKDLSHIYFKE